MTERIRLGRPDTGEAELAAVADVLETGMLTQGPVVAAFEDELARATGSRHAFAVSSGTAALHLAVLALGLDPGDEVVVPAYTFPATANVLALPFHTRLTDAELDRVAETLDKIVIHH